MTCIERRQQLFAHSHHLEQVGIGHAGLAIVQPLEILAQAATDIDKMGIRMCPHEALRLVTEKTGTCQHAPHAVAIGHPTRTVIANGLQRGSGKAIVDRHGREKCIT